MKLKDVLAALAHDTELIKHPLANVLIETVNAHVADDVKLNVLSTGKHVLTALEMLEKTKQNELLETVLTPPACMTDECLDSKLAPTSRTAAKALMLAGTLLTVSLILTILLSTGSINDSEATKEIGTTLANILVEVLSQVVSGK